MPNELYCLVNANGAVIKGPDVLPKDWVHDGQTYLSFDKIDDPTEFGWYPVEYAEVPSEQRLVNSYFALDGAVVRQMGDLEDIPPPPIIIPQEVSETQFIRACTQLGIITALEGEGYLARGELPAIMSGALDTLEEPYKTDARLKAIGSSSFSREDPVFDLLVLSGVATDEQIDGVFTLAGSLT